MSVEARDLMTDEWSRWQGHVVNGVFPLGRLIGCSEQSGVFLTRWEEPSHRDVAIKLFPANPAQTELQLQRWARAGGLAHPHLLLLLESGACQLDGFPYLYVVMEYADQTLTQLLQQRALTAEEAREMLLPILEALTYLHCQDLLLGRLKPANVLVVGDQLKLASDTIRSVSEAPLSVHAPSAYDPPDALDGTSSTADDIWSLGITLFEALTRRTLLNAAGHRSPVVLPADFSPAFRDVVSSCLRPMPQDRPDVTELVAWASGRSLQSNPETITAKAEVSQALPQVRTREALRLRENLLKPHFLIAAVLVAAAILALGWTGVRLFRTHNSANTLAADSAGELTTQTPATGAPNAAQPYVADRAPSTANPAGSDAITPFALHEIIPEVPRSAARTIRGHIKISVRAIIAADGSVSAVVANRGGPSKYFQRLAEEATKKWTFVPVQAPSPRLAQVQFDFSRDATTGHAVPVH
jgi:Protein kinase domain